ncbi:hypothetical protein S7711_06694 [Stachybotrys chartarum IBT 7711]|uniref:25S rRNA (uridine-N(3))-methyltransferase BMT5-like domain-containing protein n=1 Tax=Stachybotrys chartarum (strain CBS 109288 / IBT 7711) TaxID=1280523 RepID=A0A084APJ6_STACB|nr:hypothetical protein S7711_06694 [Stachybotrys chartarum IBT 7711]KFA47325.1 hypothetical protein S40293_06044 [Stachybotrys chartarum IBT 40293]KFA75149.1 hypothetical protein S40288_02816 [Stachybotrys chartarum IBT 40288]
MAKRRKLQSQKPSRTGGPPRPHPQQKKPPTTTKPGAASIPRRRHPQPPPEQPTVPFEPNHRILLIGEADLSFAASIIHHHGCAHVTATVLEKDLAELQAKYPHVDANITTIHDTDNRLVYAVDATKQLPTSVSRPPHDRIIFNFPHVGGKSTDVNRQVRYNQELLVSFFQRALPALAPRGSIIVTLFEGEPYTLWNIRDLGRHVGLQVERSFAFQASVYPGYHHARTLGVVKNKKGESGGGWKGEERPARSYIFMRKGEVPLQPVSKKRQRNNDDSSDDDNDE